MKIENIAVADITPYALNAKDHPPEQIDKIVYSLKKFGWVQPLVVDEAGVLVIGHGRLLAAQRLGMVEVPCVRAEDFTEAQIRELRLLDNKLNESQWNKKNLKQETAYLVTEGIDVKSLGFEIEDTTQVVEPEPEYEEESSEGFQVIVEFDSKSDARRFVETMRDKGLNAKMK